MAEKRQFLRIAKKLSMAFCFAVALFAAPAFADAVSCKNLWNRENSITLNGYTPAFSFDLPVNTYTISAITTLVDGNEPEGILIAGVTTRWNGSGNRITATITNTVMNDIRIYSGVSAVDAATRTIIFSEIQLEKGSTATSYVPYNPLCATCQGIVKNYESAAGTVAQNGTPTPTNPIEPVFYTQGDMVLRKVGDVADSYDAATGKITRRIGVKTFNGTEDLTMFSTNAYIKSDASNVAYVLSGGAKAVRDTRVVSNILSNSDGFIWQSAGYPNTVRINNNDQMHMNIANDVLGITDYTQETQESVMAKAKAFFKRMYDAGTPVTVWYPLETPVEETVTQTTYCADAIKIATTAYNTAAFAPVEQALESAVTTIKDVVANTIVQADAIQNLQDTKQTMPDANGTNGTCPRFRQCLLIETDDGTPQWFPIIDPFKDFITPILANNANITPVDAQRRYYGDQQLCTALAGTEFTKCTNDQAATYKIAASYNTEYGALNENEWGHEFKAADIGANTATDNPNNDEGIVYGISKCVSANVQTNTVVGGTKLNDVSLPYQNVLRSELERQYDYNNPTYGLDTYRHCWCKMTSIAYGGKYYKTSTAPWVFSNSAASSDCARDCAGYCAYNIRYHANLRSAILGWAVE